MWNMSNNHLPRRRRDIPQGPPLRGYSRRRPTPGTSAFDDMWMGGMGLGPGQSQGQGQSGFYGPPSFPQSRVEGLQDVMPSPRARPPRSASNRNAYVKDFSPRYGSNTDNRVPFDQAMRDLVEATYEAYRVCERSVKTFEDEIQPILNYADPRLVQALWKMKLEYDAVEGDENSRAGSAGAITYQTVMQDFNKALQGLSSAGPPELDRLMSDGAKLSPNGFTMASRRLTLIYQNIEELMEGVATERSGMHVLYKELKDAHVLLLDLEDLWKPIKMAADRKAKQAWVEPWDDNS